MKSVEIIFKIGLFLSVYPFLVGRVSSSDLFLDEGYDYLAAQGKRDLIPSTAYSSLLNTAATGGTPKSSSINRSTVPSEQTIFDDNDDDNSELDGKLDYDLANEEDENETDDTQSEMRDGIISYNPIKEWRQKYLKGDKKPSVTQPTEVPLKYPIDKKPKFLSRLKNKAKKKLKNIFDKIGLSDNSSPTVNPGPIVPTRIPVSNPPLPPYSPYYSEYSSPVVAPYPVNSNQIAYRIAKNPDSEKDQLPLYNNYNKDPIRKEQAQLLYNKYQEPQPISPSKVKSLANIPSELRAPISNDFLFDKIKSVCRLVKRYTLAIAKIRNRINYVRSINKYHPDSNTRSTIHTLMSDIRLFKRRRAYFRRSCRDLKRKYSHIFLKLARINKRIGNFPELKVYKRT